MKKREEENFYPSEENQRSFEMIDALIDEKLKRLSVLSDLEIARYNSSLKRSNEEKIARIYSLIINNSHKLDEQMAIETLYKLKLEDYDYAKFDEKELIEIREFISKFSSFPTSYEFEIKPKDGSSQRDNISSVEDDLYSNEGIVIHFEQVKRLLLEAFPAQYVNAPDVKQCFKQFVQRMNEANRNAISPKLKELFEQGYEICRLDLGNNYQNSDNNLTLESIQKEVPSTLVERDYNHEFYSRSYDIRVQDSNMPGDTFSLLDNENSDLFIMNYSQENHSKEQFELLYQFFDTFVYPVIEEKFKNNAFAQHIGIADYARSVFESIYNEEDFSQAIYVEQKTSRDFNVYLDEIEAKFNMQKNNYTSYLEKQNEILTAEELKINKYLLKKCSLARKLDFDENGELVTIVETDVVASEDTEEEIIPETDEEEKIISEKVEETTTEEEAEELTTEEEKNDSVKETVTEEVEDTKESESEEVVEETEENTAETTIEDEVKEIKSLRKPFVYEPDKEADQRVASILNMLKTPIRSNVSFDTIKVSVDDNEKRKISESKQEEVIREIKPVVEQEEIIPETPIVEEPIVREEDITNNIKENIQTVVNEKENIQENIDIKEEIDKIEKPETVAIEKAQAEFAEADAEFYQRISEPSEVKVLDPETMKQLLEARKAELEGKKVEFSLARPRRKKISLF